MKIWVKIFSFLLLFYFYSCSSDPKSPTEIAELSGDLVEYARNLALNMPGRGSEGFIQPSSSHLTEWREVIRMLLQDDIQAVETLLQISFPWYRLLRYTDSAFNNQIYFILEEQAPMAKGWGTYIINTNSKRPICVQIPHPLFDLNTHTEGADLFRRTQAMFLMIAGTHRCANSELSACDGSFSGCGAHRYPVSDMAHFADSIFQASHEVLARERPVYFFNLHGNSRTECPDIFLSHGLSAGMSQMLLDLQSHLTQNSTLTVSVAGDGLSSCSLSGSTNVQGRFSNGSHNPCLEEGLSASGFFIHIEQSRSVRDNFSSYSHLIEAVNQTITPVGRSAKQILWQGF